MSTNIKSPTKTISLRIPLDYDEYLEKVAHQTGRSKSNYIKFLIQKERELADHKWNEGVKSLNEIGKKSFKDDGLDIDQMDADAVYKYFKNL